MKQIHVGLCFPSLALTIRQPSLPTPEWNMLTPCPPSEMPYNYFFPASSCSNSWSYTLINLHLSIKSLLLSPNFSHKFCKSPHPWVLMDSKVKWGDEWRGSYKGWGRLRYLVELVLTAAGCCCLPGLHEARGQSDYRTAAGEKGLPTGLVALCRFKPSSTVTWQGGILGKKYLSAFSTFFWSAAGTSH